MIKSLSFSLRRVAARRLPTRWSLPKPKMSQWQKLADGLRCFVGIIRQNTAILFQTTQATPKLARHRQKRRKGHEEGSDVTGASGSLIGHSGFDGFEERYPRH